MDSQYKFYPRVSRALSCETCLNITLPSMHRKNNIASSVGEDVKNILKDETDQTSLVHPLVSPFSKARHLQDDTKILVCLWGSIKVPNPHNQLHLGQYLLT